MDDATELYLSLLDCRFFDNWISLKASYSIVDVIDKLVVYYLFDRQKAESSFSKGVLDPPIQVRFKANLHDSLRKSQQSIKEKWNLAQGPHVLKFEVPVLFVLQDEIQYESYEELPLVSDFLQEGLRFCVSGIKMNFKGLLHSA